MSCFCLVRTAAMLTLPLFLMLASPQSSFGLPQADGVVDENAAVVNALIRELRDPKFAVREAATQQLIELGTPAVAALKVAAESDSPEVRLRVQSILASVMKDEDSLFSGSDQNTIAQFKDSNATGQIAILRAQATAKNTSLLLHLLDIAFAEEENSTDVDNQAESPIEALVVTETISPLSQLISNALLVKDWSTVEKVMMHPGILKYTPFLRVNEARNAGQLESYIDDRFKEFSQAQAAQQKISTRELVSLIGLLRIQQDFERAETAITWLSDVDMQRVIREQLVFQQGDWQEILRRTKLVPTSPDYIAANLPQQALLHYLLGDEAAIKEVVQELRKQLQEATDAAEGLEEETAMEKILKSQLGIVGALTFDWPLMKEHLDQDNVVGNFNFMSAQNRPIEALELLDIGPQFKDRQAWMENTLEEIKDHRADMKKRTRGRRDEEYNRLKLQVTEKTELALAVADIAKQWGLDDESQLYYQMLYASSASDQVSSQEDVLRVLNQLVELGRSEDYWKLVASILSGSDQRRLGSKRIWFGVTGTAQAIANQWSSRIRGAIVDPLEHAKTIAAILNSPWVDREELDFDLDFEMARFRTGAGLSASGSDEFLMAQVLELNGRDEAAANMLQQAISLGNQEAIEVSHGHALASNEPQAIAKHWSYSESTEHCLLDEDVALKMLAVETDPEQIRVLKRQLKLSRLIMNARWSSSVHSFGWEFSMLGELDQLQLEVFQLQCDVYGASGDFNRRASRHEKLGTALASKNSDQKYQGAVELATSFFNELGGDARARNDIEWSYDAQELNLALAQGLIERKEYDRAADVLVRRIEFYPGDVSVGESVVKKLDKAGATEAADRVYKAVGEHYVETLRDYPDSPLARNNFAWLSASSNRDLETARRHAMVALEVRPHVEQYLDTLAEIEFLLGRPKEAFELSKRCVQLSPLRVYYRQQKERFRQAMTDAE